jgi:hypothetical protein
MADDLSLALKALAQLNANAAGIGARLHTALSEDVEVNEEGEDGAEETDALALQQCVLRLSAINGRLNSVATLAGLEPPPPQRPRRMSHDEFSDLVPVREVPEEDEVDSEGPANTEPDSPANYAELQQRLRSIDTAEAGFMMAGAEAAMRAARHHDSVGGGTTHESDDDDDDDDDDEDDSVSDDDAGERRPKVKLALSVHTHAPLAQSHQPTISPQPYALLP